MERRLEGLRCSLVLGGPRSVYRARRDLGRASKAYGEALKIADELGDVALAGQVRAELGAR